METQPIQIREVWASNLAAEFELISELIDKFPFVSMDTEFPGIIHKSETGTGIGNYNLLKSNVNDLKLIQVGITLTDSAGNLPVLDGSRCIWEFNFREFNPKHDPHAETSITLLKKIGIDFARNVSHGVDASQFAELLMSSGLVCNDSVTWVTFHCCYDFGYLVKLLSGQPLPETSPEFMAKVRVYFGNRTVYDVKYLARFCDNLFGGLNRIAETLKLDRVAGKAHQAGSDSLLTWHVFQKIREIHLVNGQHEQYAGRLYGLNVV